MEIGAGLGENLHAIEAPGQVAGLAENAGVVELVDTPDLGSGG